MMYTERAQKVRRRPGHGKRPGQKGQQVVHTEARKRSSEKF